MQILIFIRGGYLEIFFKIVGYFLKKEKLRGLSLSNYVSVCVCVCLALRGKLEIKRLVSLLGKYLKCWISGEETSSKSTTDPSCWKNTGHDSKCWCSPLLWYVVSLQEKRKKGGKNEFVAVQLVRNCNFIYLHSNLNYRINMRICDWLKTAITNVVWH